MISFSKLKKNSKIAVPNSPASFSKIENLMYPTNKNWNFNEIDKDFYTAKNLNLEFNMLLKNNLQMLDLNKFDSISSIINEIDLRIGGPENRIDWFHLILFIFRFNKNEFLKEWYEPRQPEIVYRLLLSLPESKIKNSEMKFPTIFHKVAYCTSLCRMLRAIGKYEEAFIRIEYAKKMLPYLDKFSNERIAEYDNSNIEIWVGLQEAFTLARFASFKTAYTKSSQLNHLFFSRSTDPNSTNITACKYWILEIEWRFAYSNHDINLMWSVLEKMKNLKQNEERNNLDNTYLDTLIPVDILNFRTSLLQKVMGKRGGMKNNSITHEHVPSMLFEFLTGGKEGTVNEAILEALPIMGEAEPLKAAIYDEIDDSEDMKMLNQISHKCVYNLIAMGSVIESIDKTYVTTNQLRTDHMCATSKSRTEKLKTLGKELFKKEIEEMKKEIGDLNRQNIQLRTNNETKQRNQGYKRIIEKNIGVLENTFLKIWTDTTGWISTTQYNKKHQKNVSTGKKWYEQDYLTIIEENYNLESHHYDDKKTIRIPQNIITRVWVKWCQAKFKKDIVKFHPYRYLSKTNGYYKTYTSKETNAKGTMRSVDLYGNMWKEIATEKPGIFSFAHLRIWFNFLSVDLTHKIYVASARPKRTKKRNNIEVDCLKGKDPIFWAKYLHGLDLISKALSKQMNDMNIEPMTTKKEKWIENFDFSTILSRVLISNSMLKEPFLILLSRAISLHLLLGHGKTKKSEIINCLKLISTNLDEINVEYDNPVRNRRNNIGFSENYGSESAINFAENILMNKNGYSESHAKLWRWLLERHLWFKTEHGEYKFLPLIINPIIGVSNMRKKDTSKKEKIKEDSNKIYNEKIFNLREKLNSHLIDI